MLAEAGEKLGSRATLLIQDSEWLPEFSEPFDVIISSNVLHYIENPADWLGQLSHLLKSDGVVILQDFSKSSRAVRYGTWLMRWLDPQYRRAYSAEEAQAFSSKAGLSVQRVATFPITWWYEGWLISS